MKTQTKVICTLFFVIFIMGVFVWGRIDNNDRGVCEAAGRQLTPDELRKKMIVSFFKYKLHYALQFNEWRDIGKVEDIKIALTPENLTTDRLVTLINNSLSNSKSFNDNFSLYFVNYVGVDPLKKLEKLINNKGSIIQESTYGDSSFTVYPMSKIDFARPSLIDASWLDRFQGYGQYTLYVYNFTGDMRCCEQENPAEVGRKQHTSDIYLHKLSFDEKRIWTHEEFEVSNCGDIKLERISFGNNP